MTEKELLCTPFEVSLIIIKGCYQRDLTAQEEAEFLTILEEEKEQFQLKLLDEESTQQDIYRAVLPALHIALPAYYQRLLNVVPLDVFNCLQGRLYYLPPSAPNVKINQLTDEFLDFYEYLMNESKPEVLKPIWSDHMGLYIRGAFVMTLVNVANSDAIDIEPHIEEAIKWVGDKIKELEHSYIHVHLDKIIENGDVKATDRIREDATDIIERANIAPLSSFLPDGVRGKPIEKIHEAGGKLIDAMKWAERKINENKRKGIVITDSFSQWFDNIYDAQTCILLMQKWGLIGADGVHNIGERDKAKLLAFVEGLQQKALITPDRSAETITKDFAQQIGLSYPRPRKDKVEEYKYKDYLSQFISKLNKVSTDKLTWEILADSGR